MKINKVILPVVLLVLPRMSVSYIFYFLSALLSVRIFDIQPIFRYVSFLFVVICFYIFKAMGGYVSITAFVLELVLITPIMLYVFDFKVRFSKASCIYALRNINIIVMFLSFANMIINYGFPAKLPYVHFLPDAYGGFYGLGGAKIVTVIGFYGLAVELMWAENKSKIFLFSSLMNFIFPSYLLGVLMGTLAISIYYFKNVKTLLYAALLLLFLVPIVGPYAIDRSDNINNEFSETTGYHPKVFAYLNVLSVLENNPSTLLTGVGLGQFSSTSALWASEYMAELSSHEKIRLPGFHMSDVHEKYMGNALLFSNIWAISSSANKPYTSLSSLLAEIGLPLTLFLIYMFIKRSFKFGFKDRKAWVIVVFFALMCIVDQWHDSIWIGWLMLMISGIKENETPSR
ncbi:hypothetical protein OW491_14790 [Neptunomonas sp. CHC150]|uniref:hypothetical protein n=1 Tax=Neptunomonas sp. CHC150 TaxID=2998324 RepID=UPI0025B0E73F|nr:hypothetical protein [Neptunomonas sp. CHC150]MDN2661075.1 hypothetical protein [Neptunomonas sp. CHC150]